MEDLAEQFEEARPHLRAVAYRMLGSSVEAEDAVQEAWLRLARADGAAIANLRGWLTTVVARVCLDALRARRARHEEPLPELLVALEPAGDPADEAVLADSVGLALLVVLEQLTPAERLAFVLHDMFGVPFEEIAGIVDRSPAAARQLASRARRRVRGAAPEPDADPALQRRVVEAFLAASRGGDFEALVRVLDPDVVFRTDTGRPDVEGAAAVAEQILVHGAPFAPLGRPARVNGGPGAIVIRNGRPFAVVGFTIAGGRIAAIDLVRDPRRLADVSV